MIICGEEDHKWRKSTVNKGLRGLVTVQRCGICETYRSRETLPARKALTIPKTETIGKGRK